VSVVTSGTASPPQSHGIVPSVSVGGVVSSEVTTGGTLSQLHGSVPSVSVGAVSVVAGVESVLGVVTTGGTLSQLQGSVPSVSVGGVTESDAGVESVEGVETSGGTLSQLQGSVPPVSVGGVTVSLAEVGSVTAVPIVTELGLSEIELRRLLIESDEGLEATSERPEIESGETETEVIPEVSPIDESPLEITSLGLLVTSPSPPDKRSEPVGSVVPISILPPSVKSSALACDGVVRPVAYAMLKPSINTMATAKNPTKIGRCCKYASCLFCFFMMLSDF
jgi:hypothetical protein